MNVLLEPKPREKKERKIPKSMEKSKCIRWRNKTFVGRAHWKWKLKAKCIMSFGHTCELSDKIERNNETKTKETHTHTKTHKHHQASHRCFAPTAHSFNTNSNFFFHHQRTFLAQWFSMPYGIANENSQYQKLSTFSPLFNFRKTQEHLVYWGFSVLKVLVHSHTVEIKIVWLKLWQSFWTVWNGTFNVIHLW